MAEVAELKETIPKMEAEEKAASKALDDALAQIPNLPLDEVPDGKDANDNVEHHRFGAKRDYPFAPKQHFDLGEALGQMDFEIAAKLSGARFVVLKKGLARLERALGQFMLDVHTSEPHNYTEVAPPILVRDEVMFGTAQLPKFEEDQFDTVRRLATRDFECVVEQATSIDQIADIDVKTRRNLSSSSDRTANTSIPVRQDLLAEAHIAARNDSGSSPPPKCR